ncbi:MAG: hypothetical protein AB7K24_06580, partial [Gemmataceae bacterium]
MMRSSWSMLLGALFLSTGCGRHEPGSAPAPEASLAQAGAQADAELFRPEQDPFAPGQHAAGNLRIIDGIPVLSVQGSPDEIGTQVGALTRTPLQRMITFPRRYLTHFGYGAAYPALVAMGSSMVPR